MESTDETRHTSFEPCVLYTGPEAGKVSNETSTTLVFGEKVSTSKSVEDLGVQAMAAIHVALRNVAIFQNESAYDSIAVLIKNKDIHLMIVSELFDQKNGHFPHQNDGSLFINKALRSAEVPFASLSAITISTKLLDERNRQRKAQGGKPLHKFFTVVETPQSMKEKYAKALALVTPSTKKKNNSTSFSPLNEAMNQDDVSNGMMSSPILKQKDNNASRGMSPAHKPAAKKSKSSYKTEEKSAAVDKVMNDAANGVPQKSKKKKASKDAKGGRKYKQSKLTFGGKKN